MPRAPLFLLALLSGCQPGPNRIAIAKHALLEQGFHQLRLEGETLRCFPSAGFEFAASTAHGERVRGVVCCGSSEGEVRLDGAQHP